MYMGNFSDRRTWCIYALFLLLIAGGGGEKKIEKKILAVCYLSRVFCSHCWTHRQYMKRYIQYIYKGDTLNMYVYVQELTPRGQAMPWDLPEKIESVTWVTWQSWSDVSLRQQNHGMNHVKIKVPPLALIIMETCICTGERNNLFVSFLLIYSHYLFLVYLCSNSLFFYLTGLQTLECVFTSQQMTTIDTDTVTMVASCSCCSAVS